MTQINTTYQTIQTKHQQYTNQLNQLTQYKQDKNKVQYIPNSSNSLDVELRNAENYYDRLEGEFNLEKQMIETTTQYVESLVVHKEKLQSDLIQQNKNMEETKNKMKEIGEKVCEIAKRDADEKNKKLEDEERKQHERIAREFEEKRKRVNEEYEERTNKIKKAIMEANEYEKMNQVNQAVFIHERSKLEEWTGKKCSEIIFDSNKWIEQKISDKFNFIYSGHKNLKI
jgi:chromosome segregation ATPase